MNGHHDHPSARPSSGNGTERPSALAVFRFMYSSTFVACWIGRSAGLVAIENAPDVDAGLTICIRRGRKQLIEDQVFLPDWAHRGRPLISCHPAVAGSFSMERGLDWKVDGLPHTHSYSWELG
jgi:hypothetical protein